MKRPQLDPQLQTARYFDTLEDQIVSRLHQEAETDEARASLLRATGIRDPRLIDELTKMGITADVLIALRLLPLVLVAWAGDRTDAKEQEAIRDEATSLGILEGSEAWVVLENWLRRRPPGISVDAWKRYTQNTLSQMSPSSANRLIELTRRQMTVVARASGGVLGFGKISAKEREMIDRLIKVMRGHVAT